MKGLGEGIAFAGLIAGATYLEVSGKPAIGLWLLIVVWAMFSDWGQKKKEVEEE